MVEASGARVRTTLLLAALIGASTWSALVLGARSDAVPLSAPKLTLPVARCELSTAEAAELVEHSRRLAAAARARIERLALRPADGLPALRVLQQAIACAAQAGGDTTALEASAQGLRSRIEADYRERALRLGRALELDEPDRARADIEVLAALLEGEEHAFARRVRNLRADLTDEASR